MDTGEFLAIGVSNDEAVRRYRKLESSLNIAVDQIKRMARVNHQGHNHVTDWQSCNTISCRNAVGTLESITRLTGKNYT